VYLSSSEFAARKEEVFDGYYRDLGGCVLKLKGRDFWTFHRQRLREMGCEMEWDRVARATLREVLVEAKSPLTHYERLLLS
jgi:hypothetical protein